MTSPPIAEEAAAFSSCVGGRDDHGRGGASLGAATVEVIVPGAAIVLEMAPGVRSLASAGEGRLGARGSRGVVSAVPRSFLKAASASSISRAVVHRSARSMRSARCTTSSSVGGIRSSRELGAGAGSVRILARTATGDVAAWAHLPVSISKSIAPTDHTSARASTSGSPFACSGAM